MNPWDSSPGRLVHGRFTLGPRPFVGCPKRLAQLDESLSLAIPALRCILGRVEIALDTDLVASFGKRQQPAHWRRVPSPVIASQRGDVDKVHIPFSLDVGTPIDLGIGPGVRVRAEPQIDRPGMRRQIPLEDLSIRLLVKEIQVRGTLRATFRVVPVILPSPFRCV